MSDPSKYDKITHTRHHNTFLAMMLALSQLRSSYVIGKALYEKWPNNDDWVRACSSHEVVELVDEFGEMITDIRDTVAMAPITGPEEAQSAVAEHYGQALASVADFAQLIGVEGEDLLAVLVNYGRVID